MVALLSQPFAFLLKSNWCPEQQDVFSPLRNVATKTVKQVNHKAVKMANEVFQLQGQ